MKDRDNLEIKLKLQRLAIADCFSNIHAILRCQERNPDEMFTCLTNLETVIRNQIIFYKMYIKK